MGGSTPVRKTSSFFEFSLCLSRACLGKMIVFIYKWLQKAVFSAGVASGDYTLDNFQQAYGDVEERKVRESLLLVFVLLPELFGSVF
jgi:hypothetical protein